MAIRFRITNSEMLTDWIGLLIAFLLCIQIDFEGVLVQYLYFFDDFRWFRHILATFYMILIIVDGFRATF